MSQFLTKYGQRYFTSKVQRVSDGKLKFIFNVNSQNDTLGSSIMETVYNRPKQMNCQDLEMQSKMLSQFKFWHENPDQVPKYMLIYGAEVKTQELWHRFYVTFYYVMREYSKMQKPFRIAIYNGITIGAGTGYTITGPIRIATEKTVFSMPEVSVGYLADSGCTYYFPRICGNALGMHLGVTGMKVYGKDLVKYGLATHFIDSQNVEKLKQDLLHNLQADTPESEAFRIVEKYSIPIEDKTIENMNQIEEIYQYDSYQEAYKRLMRSNTKFAQSIKDLMKKETHSPLSHALIYELIKKGITQTHEECLFNEYRAQMAFWDSNEFREGTRAKLVDRDNNPNWQHKSVDQVPIDSVKFFTEYPIKEYIDDLATLDQFPYWNHDDYKPVKFI